MAPSETGLVAIENSSSQLVWLDSSGRETGRSQDLFLGVKKIGSQLYAYHKEGVFRVGGTGLIDRCPGSKDIEGIEALIPVAGQLWVLRESDSHRTLQPMACDRQHSTSPLIPIPQAVFPVSTQGGLVGIGEKRPFEVWSIAPSGAATLLSTLAQESESLPGNDLFLQGIEAIGRSHLLALLTDLLSSQRHLLVISADGRIVSETRLNAPVGLAGSDRETGILFMNIARPTGGEVLAYRWRWQN